MLEDPRYGVEGFKLLGGSKVTDAEFDDDTNLFLVGTKENLERARSILELYCLASSSKLNWNKTYGIWASRRDRLFTWEWRWGSNG